MATPAPAPTAEPAPDNEQILTPELADKVKQINLGEKVEELHPTHIKAVVDALKNKDTNFLEALWDIKRLVQIERRQQGKTFEAQHEQKLEAEIKKLLFDAIDGRVKEIQAKREAAEKTVADPAADPAKKDGARKVLEAMDLLLDLLAVPPEHIVKPIKPTTSPETGAENADRTIPLISEIKTPEDVKRLEAVLRNVVDQYGREPAGSNPELFWKKRPGEAESKKLTAEEIPLLDDAYSFLTMRINILNHFDEESAAKIAELEQDIAEIRARNVKPTPAMMAPKVEEKVREILESSHLKETLNHIKTGMLNRDIGEAPARALMLHTLGVKTLPEAFDKLKNVLQLGIVPSVRKGKEIFKEEKDAEGKPKVMKLSEFLAQPEHAGYREQMVEDTHAVLFQLYETAGRGMDLDLAGFRDILIQVIKTRGEGKDIKAGERTLSAEEAKRIYTSFLILKNAHLGEKEALQLLIAFREKPPFVVDLRNTNDGWETFGPQKLGVGALEDFCLDGMIYTELREKLGMTKRQFNTFIIKIAPQFEKLRSIFTKNPNATPEGFTPDEIAKFKELMNIPLWIDKVGQAYKHALHDNQERSVPVITKHQGPDTKKLDIMFVNIEEKLTRISERLADERLDQELKEAGPQGWEALYRIDKVACKWWKRNAALGYREKYAKEIKARLKSDPKYRTELMELPRDQVKPSTGPFHPEKWSGATPAVGTPANLNTELDAIAERFGVSFATGDQESYLHDSERPLQHIQNEAIQQSISDLCQAYVDERLDRRIDDAEFRQRMRAIIRQIQTMKGTNDEIVSFLEEARDRGTVDEHKEGLLDKLRAHRAGLIALDLDHLRININLGTAKNVDVKTKVGDHNWSDNFARKMVDRMQKHSGFLGRFITPATVGIIGFGLANVGTQIAASRTLRWGAIAMAPWMGGAALIPVAVGCLFGGTFAAMRKNQETMYHKAQKERRDAMDYQPPSDRKGFRPNQAEGNRFERRMEPTLYQKQSANVLRDLITNAVTYDELRNTLANASARNHLSEAGRRDLIKFTDEQHIESERLGLVRAISEGRIRLRTLAPAGADYIADLQMATSISTNVLNGQIDAAEAEFKKFKRKENLKTFGIGALVGGGIAGVVSGIGAATGWTDGTIEKHGTSELTSGGPVARRAGAGGLADLLEKQGGLTPQEARSLAFDAHGKPTYATELFLKTKGIHVSDLPQAPHTITKNVSVPLFAGNAVDKNALTIGLAGKVPLVTSDFDVDGHLTPSGVARLAGRGIHVSKTFGVTTTPVVGFAGPNMNKTELVTALSGRGISVKPTDFDPAGHFHPGAVTRAALNGKGIVWVEHAVPGVPPVAPPLPPTLPGAVPGAPALPSHGGFAPLSHGIHSNGHTPKHILDELRTTWVGKPGAGPDGQFHFSLKGMTNSGLTHTTMPSGVNMPTKAENFTVALQVKEGGRNLWKFLPVEPNGQFKVPPEYFDGTKANYIPRGGSQLPGLKTHGLAVGFIDKTGKFQVLSSATGDDSYVIGSTPSPVPVPPGPVVPSTPGTIHFTADQKDVLYKVTEVQERTIEVPSDPLYKVTKDTVDYSTETMVTVPFVAAPMSHLEYGKREEQQPEPAPETNLIARFDPDSIDSLARRAEDQPDAVRDTFLTPEDRAQINILFQIAERELAAAPSADASIEAKRTVLREALVKSKNLLVEDTSINPQTMLYLGRNLNLVKDTLRELHVI